MSNERIWVLESKTPDERGRALFIGVDGTWVTDVDIARQFDTRKHARLVRRKHMPQHREQLRITSYVWVGKMLGYVEWTVVHRYRLFCAKTITALCTYRDRIIDWFK